MFTLGDAFLGGAQVHGTHHLWFVINTPLEHGNTALMVNISSLSSVAETTCILQGGEHPFITRESYVRYGSTRQALVAELCRAEARGLIHRQERASQRLVEKLRAGAMASPRLAKKFLALL